MSFDPPGASGTPAPGRRPFRPTAQRRAPRALVPVLMILVALIIGFLILTDLVTDLWWFRSAEYSDVFTSRLTTRIVLFAVFATLMAGLVALNVVIAYRLRPPFRGMSAEQQNLDRYRVGLDPFKIPILLAVSTVVGIMAGTSAAAEWRTWLLWRNGQPFEEKDPQFGKNVSFYVFDYPWWRFLLGFAFAVVLVALLASVVVHYLYGGLRLQTPGDKATPGAQVHLSVLLGLFVLLKAIAYWMDRYGLVVSGGGFDQVSGWSGLRYKDENALLPAKEILAVIALICAVLFFANIWRRTWLLPGIGFGLLVLSAVLIGTAYPAIVQQFQVKPSEAQKEAPYIERNIKATRDAYGLKGAQVDQYNAKTTVQAGQLRADANTTASVRLLDPNIVSPTFEQEQQFLSFYSFPDSLRIDRYNIDGRNQDVVAAVRELNLDQVPPTRRNWINDHFLYTHGFGLVAARGTSVEEDGTPSYVSKDIPPTGVLGEYEPRIYFGEESPDYSIVGSKDGTPREFDREDRAAPNGQVLNTYQGKGGVEIGSFWRKAMYALKFREQKILLSSEVNSSSRVLYIRDPRERVQRVAPWLTLDSDPYPAVIQGKVQWVVDGYTTSGNYPYASRTTLGKATQTTLTDEERRVIAPRDEVNYIRNSVKATVDAYDGTIQLYAWDESDPVLKTWRKAFPGTVKEKKEIPSALLAHLRYPEDFFKVQREMLTRYHVTDPASFYTKADFWQVPTDPSGSDASGAVRTGVAAAVPPYYLTLKMPSQSAATFSLTSTFEPINRPNLAAFMAVNAEPGPDYGKIRILQLPSGSTVDGPSQAHNRMAADQQVGEIKLRYKGNSILSGNLLTLPVGGGLLYVEPMYVQPERTTTAFPRLAQVLVSFGDKVAIDDDLKGALDQLFGGQSGATTSPGSGAGAGEGAAPPPAGQAPAPAKAPTLADALADARKAFDDGRAALAKGDFAGYGKAQQKLADALERAEAAQGKPPAKAPAKETPDAKATSPPAKT